jgi:hypothetical protein
LNQILKPFNPAHLATFPEVVWVVDESLGFVQQNQQAADATQDWSAKSGTNTFILFSTRNLRAYIS